MTIDTILHRYDRFGIHLGLERIEQLLADLADPHRQVPIIHVAGTNGKGSVCAYLSAVLTQAGYRVGRYTSPHLVNWQERICLNEQPIAPAELEKVLQQVEHVIRPQAPPTQFELITAAAWLYFAQQQVEGAVIEGGLGGRLDATNVCEAPLVSVITSISREHLQRLGPTLADIAGEKAGILKQGCPAVVGLLPPEARAVVAQRIQQLNCPAVWPQPALDLGNGLAQFQEIQYPLPLRGQIQLMNSALAIAAVQILRQRGWQISDLAISQGIAQTRWPGRLQWSTWRDRPLLIDGAHNPAAAKALRQFVDTLGDGPIHWIVGMLATKDHDDILQILLQPGDSLYLVPVPDHSSADPQALATLAKQICPGLSHCQIYSDWQAGLIAADSGVMVLCGSLYLAGDFLKHR